MIDHQDALQEPSPSLTLEQALVLAESTFGISGEIGSLPSERDQNFALGQDRGGWVLKVANPAEEHEFLDLQVKTLAHLNNLAQDLPVARLRQDRGGNYLAKIELPDGRDTIAWMVQLLPGTTLESSPNTISPEALATPFARLSRAMRSFYHASGNRHLLWDLGQALDLKPVLSHTTGPALPMVEEVLSDFERSKNHYLTLRRQFIHNDLNPANLLQKEGRLTGVVDFGDMVHGPMINDLAIAAAYQMYEVQDPEDFINRMIQSWHEQDPLLAEELEILPLLILIRMTQTVVISHWRAAEHPANRDYILLHTRRAEEAVKRWGSSKERARLASRWLRGCGMATQVSMDFDQLLATRHRVLGPSLRLFYDTPITLQSGSRSELIAQDGTRYLDGYNNVAHVGHSHPAVVTAISRQAQKLNTNTRYLIEPVVQYAQRLADLFPDPLNVVRFTCTGSEATDLAIRIARAASGNYGALVSQHAYHGNTEIGLSVSPEETGLEVIPDWVATLPIAETFRQHPDRRAESLVREASARLSNRSHAPAALLFDTLFTSDGIFIPPAEVIQTWIDDARSLGAVWIADEVQPGFGRTGDFLWGFERLSRVPDMVTLGKPMGNGFPMAAIIMTQEMAQAAQSVYYFNTFAGNPVAAAAGQAVLDVIEDEDLRNHAHSLGALLKARVDDLARKHPRIAEFRGLGLHGGLDLIDPQSGQPDSAFASRLVNQLKEMRVLVGRTGQFQNVVKIRPPLVITRPQLTRILESIDQALSGP